MEKFAAVFKKVQKINKAIIGAVLLLYSYRHFADLLYLRA